MPVIQVIIPFLYAVRASLGCPDDACGSYSHKTGEIVD
jgi:hypothetical protein